MEYYNINSKQFRKWTPSEEQQLLNEINNNLPIEEIAGIHNRSKRGIQYRLIDLAIVASKDGLNDVDIYKKTRITREQMNKRIEEKEIEFMNKKEEQKADPDNRTILYILKQMQEDIKILKEKNT